MIRSLRWDGSKFRHYSMWMLSVSASYMAYWLLGFAKISATVKSEDFKILLIYFIFLVSSFVFLQKKRSFIPFLMSSIILSYFCMSIVFMLAFLTSGAMSFDEFNILSGFVFAIFVAPMWYWAWLPGLLFAILRYFLPGSKLNQIH